jgi:CBS domain containing-hemolysin-like protein
MVQCAFTGWSGLKSTLVEAWSTRCTARRMAKMKYFLKIAPGWLAIGLLLYVYVIKQAELVANIYVLTTVISVGMLLSFVCSGIEMAIASLGQAELTQLQEEADQITARQGQMARLEYINAQMRVLGTLQIYYEAERLNAPIVICNNVANVVVAAFLPLALKASTQAAHGIAVNFFGLTVLFPGEGTEALTFFLTLFSIVVVGEIIPKRLGMIYSLWFVRKLGWVIRLINLLFGWLGAAFLSVVDIPTRILTWIRQ